jgi:hypothetical protein
LEYNPFTERYSAIQRRVRSTEDEREECSQQLVWHSNFALGAEAEALAASKRETGRIRSAINGLKERRNSEAAKEGQLSQKAKLGLDPRRWFSAERIQHAKQRDVARERVAKLDMNIAKYEAEAATVLQACEQRQSQLDKYRGLNPLELKAKLRALELRLEQLRLELSKLVVDKQRVDALLSAPLLEQQQLNDRLASLQGEVTLAESFERRLSGASNSYEKAMVHEECSKAFSGESGPGRVKQKKHRDMQAVRRNLEKVEARLKQIGQLASRPISTLVIDGNNLCYEGREFIGLAPLHALTYALAGSYHVIVVFDSSIRKLLRMNDQQVAYDFPREVRVHIVASKQAADQTVLESASALDAYVISNDRFRDFTDKAAVSGQRLIRHEIVAGKVLIHDLNLAVAFEQEWRALGDARAI